MPQALVVERALRVADAAIAGEMELLEACRAIVSLRDRLGELPTEAVDHLAGVESDLEDVPDPASARLWDEEGLRRKLKRRDEHIDAVRDELLESFRVLRTRLTRSLNDAPPEG